MYHAGNRDLQEQFGSTALADRLVERTHRSEFSEADWTFIEHQPFFFLATASPDGARTARSKAGRPDSCESRGPTCLRFRTTTATACSRASATSGRIRRWECCCITLTGEPKRLRVNGRARVELDDAMLRSLPGAQALIRLRPSTFPNCPRYVPDLVTGTPSKYGASRRGGAGGARVEVVRRLQGRGAATPGAGCPARGRSGPVSPADKGTFRRPATRPAGDAAGIQSTVAGRPGRARPTAGSIPRSWRTLR